jgi:multiple sugar transport system ATP-binding protein
LNLSTLDAAPLTTFIASYSSPEGLFWAKLSAASTLELYERPANLFVAGFIGSPKMNFITGEIASRYGAATIGVRPEHLKVDAGGQGWPGKVVIAEHLGSDTFLYVDAGPLGTLTVRGAGEIGVKMGDQVTLVPDPSRVYRFDANGNAIFA